MLEGVIQRNTEAVIKLTEVMSQTMGGAPAATGAKKPRRTKAQIEADEAKAAAEKAGTTSPGLDLGLDLGLGGPKTETPAGNVTQAQMKAEGHRLVECGENQAGLAKAKEVMAAHGFQKIDDVPETMYSTLYNGFKKEAENWGKSIANTQL